MMINKDNLLFYKEYEEFYDMANCSVAFKAYCKDAFGQDFSQDGFSDINQIEEILRYVPCKKNTRILDVGCGNGKMLGFLQGKTDCAIYGFDYSEKAIQEAAELYPTNAEFRQGIIGEIGYSEDFFDVIISMDTLYFAKDMKSFVAQVKSWLKPEGVFFVGYQEGDVMPKTASLENTEIVKALVSNQMDYKAVDITERTYKLLRKKRESAKLYREAFIAEGNGKWFDMLMIQTKCSEDSFEEFANKMSRYLFVIRK